MEALRARATVDSTCVLTSVFCVRRCVEQVFLACSFTDPHGVVPLIPWQSIAVKFGRCTYAVSRTQHARNTQCSNVHVFCAPHMATPQGSDTANRFHLRSNIACSVRETTTVHRQNSRLRTVRESKATPSRTIPRGSVKLHAKNLLYASSYAKHGSSNASEIDCTWCVVSRSA